MKKRGRPAKDEKRPYRFEVRMSGDEINALEQMSFERGKTRTEIIRESIKFYNKAYRYVD